MMSVILPLLLPPFSDCPRLFHALLDAGNKKLVFWFVRVDDEGYPEIARCTEREFATILAGISAGGMYCPECGTVHWPDGVAPPF
ncbi:hypothetical protein HEN65_020315 [Escherichia coli]|nr:hypothetical protein [Escherichia coli]